MHNAARADSVVTIDPHYIHPGRAAVYLIDANGSAAFMDASTPRSLPILLRALEERGLRPEQVEYVVVTHVHLDHSAGTAALLQACPNAVALAHPRAARHLAAPARLVESAKRVYGEELFDSLYGTVDAVPAERVRTVTDGESLKFGNRTLTFLHTAGHARHHICMHDSGSNGVFTGDAFGVSYPPVRHGARNYLLCSCTPTDFDAEAAREAVHRIVATGAERAYLTHFGPFESLKEGAEELLHTIDDMEDIRVAAIESGLKGMELRAFCGERVHEAIVRQLDRCGIKAGPEDWQWLNPDVHMNALGLVHVIEHAR